MRLVKATDDPKNRHGWPIPLLAVLVTFACLFHVTALVKMTVADHFALIDALTIKEMTIIKFVQRELWMPFIYIALVAGSVLHLEIKGAPRCTVWVTFSAFVLPILIYIRACTHIVFQTHLH